MTIEAKLETLLNTVDAKNAEVDALKTVVDELKDAVAAAQAAPVVDMKNDDAELKAKFYEMVKSGEGAQGMDIVKEGQIKSSSFNVSSATSAGAGVVTEVARDIVKRMLSQYQVPSMFGRRSVSSTKYERRVQKGSTGARWEGENVSAANGAHTATPEFATIALTHGKVVSKPVISQEALTDAFFDVEAFILNDTVAQMGRYVAEAVMNGDGSNKPKGFYKYFDSTEGVKDVTERKVDHFPVLVKEHTTDADLIAALRAMPFKLIAGYRAGAKYIVSEALFERIAALQDNTGRPLMQQSLDAAVAGRIFGYDIVVDAHIPEDVPAVFGRADLAFEVVDIPTALDMIRNPYKIDFCVEYTVAQRIGTIVADNQAVVGLKAA